MSLVPTDEDRLNALSLHSADFNAAEYTKRLLANTDFTTAFSTIILSLEAVNAKITDEALTHMTPLLKHSVALTEVDEKAKEIKTRMLDLQSELSELKITLNKKEETFKSDLERYEKSTHSKNNAI